MAVTGYIYGLLRLLDLVGWNHKCVADIVTEAHDALGEKWPTRKVGEVDVPEEPDVCSRKLVARLGEFSDGDPSDAIRALDVVLPRLRAKYEPKYRIGNAMALRAELAEDVKDYGGCESQPGAVPETRAEGEDS